MTRTGSGAINFNQTEKLIGFHAMKKTQKLVFLLLLAGVSGSVYSAGACTYREAIMALEQGNTVRGMALMRMAHRDGDERASQFLVKKDFHFETTSVASSQNNSPLVSLIKTDPK